MKSTTLIFPSLSRLWEFKLTIKATSVEINTDKRSLCGEFTAEEIELALQSFHASVLQTKLNVIKDR
jgi:hypothetical protein